MEHPLSYSNYTKNSFCPELFYGINVVSEPEHRKKQIVKVSFRFYEGKNMLFIKIPDDQICLGKILTIEGIDWSEEYESWCIEHKSRVIFLLFTLFQGIAWVDISTIPNPYLKNTVQTFQEDISHEIDSDATLCKEKYEIKTDSSYALPWEDSKKEALKKRKFYLQEFIPSSTRSGLSDQEEIDWYEKNIISKFQKPQVIKSGVENILYEPEDVEKTERLKFLENTLKEEIYEELESFKSWMRQQRYSENTITTYYDCLTVFFRFYNTVSISEFTNDDLIFFNDKYIIANRLSASYQNQIISAIRMFFQKKINIELDISSIERPRRYKKLPKVISKQDVEKMLKGVKNYKHKMALTLIYACGLRRNELLNLKCDNICFKRKTLTILNAKGFKDRVLPLSDKLLALISTYLELYKPKLYFIEGAYPGTMYGASSLLEIFHKNMDEVLPENRFTLHCLRHSFATHLLESGTDLRYIQTLLGHKSSKTTEIYTWVSMKSLHNIKNPSDDFDL